MDEIIYAIKVADLSYSGLKIFDVKIGKTTNVDSTLARYRRSHRSIEILDLWESNRSKTLSDCETGIHKIAEKYAYEREREKFIFLQESYKKFSENVDLLLKNVPKDKIEQEEKVTTKTGKWRGVGYTRKKPRLIIFRGKAHKVSSWREVLHTVAKQIYGSQKNFNMALSIKGTKRDYFSKDSGSLVDPVKIKKTPYFFEGNISANQVVRIIEQLLNVFGYDGSDLKIECRQKTSE